MKQSKLLAVVLCLVLPAILSTGALQAQHDLGPRGDLPGAGGAFPTLNANEQAFFNQAFLRFQEVQSVSGDILGEDSGGLGPTFNGNSCTMCHAQPAIGGSSPGLASPQNPIPNPQVALANLDVALNTDMHYRDKFGIPATRGLDLTGLWSRVPKFLGPVLVRSKQSN